MSNLVIKASGLSKSFGDRILWSDLSFTVDRGEMLALTGVSGSSKSTLLNCLGVLDRVDSGTITVGGVTVTSLGPGAADVTDATLSATFFRTMPSLRTPRSSTI